MKKTIVFPVIAAFLAALLASSSLASASATNYWRGSNGTLWTAGDNWSIDTGGTIPVSFSANAIVNFSATGSSNSSNTDLGGDQTISSLTINTTAPVGISGGNLTVNGDISVGSSSSNNSLQISNGVAVSAASVWAGAEVGANNNQLTVGANATLTLTDDIYVGGNGSSNNLTITNGGAVSAFYMSAGREAVSNDNQVTVGANATLTLADILDVGFHGSSNNLTLTNGGAVSANYTSVGREAGSNNNAILVTSNASMLINNDLIVGEAGSSNSMTISDGGRVASSVGYIGKDATSANNTVTVTGTNSTWTNNGTLTVGDTGPGTLNILNGGLVTVGNVNGVSSVIGAQVGSNGTVTVNGGSWMNSAGLYVGNAGNGTLEISGNGSVSSKLGVIGSFAEAIGLARVSSGTWTNTDELYVGNYGNGTLEISGTGTVSSAVSAIANFADSKGVAKVSGGNWTNSAELHVGNEGNGTLEISGNGTIASKIGTIANLSGSKGLAKILAGAWTNTDEFFVGNSGNGTLELSGTGLVSSARSTIGNEAAANGLAKVSGGTWTNSAELQVGNAGNGTLEISGNGSVSSGSGSIANLTGSNGTAKVTGGSWTNTEELYVGNGGNGTLEISGIGSVSSKLGVIASFADAIGAAKVSGGTWANSETLYVGNYGNGTLEVSGNGTVTSGVSAIANFAGSKGVAKVSGGNWTNSAELHVGNAGNGTMEISGNGSVSSMIGTVANIAGSTGLAKISAGSWTNTNGLYVGNFGNGTMEISGSGRVASADAAIANDAASTGVVRVSGGNWTNTGHLAVGVQGNGTLRISGTGSVSSGNATIGASSGSKGLVTVTGGTWTNNGSLAVGQSGNGTLNIQNGGTVNVAGGNGIVTLGANAGSIGILNMGIFGGSNSTAGTLAASEVRGGNGTATLNFNQTSNATFAPMISGSTAVNQLGAGTLTLTGNNTYSGTTTVNSGTLTTSGNDKISDSSAVSVNSGATFSLGGTETVASIAGAGDFSLNAYTLTAGGDNSSTSVSGAITGSGSFVKTGTNTLTLSGNNTYTGGTTLAGGTLSLGSSQALGTEGTLSFSGGSLQFTTYNTTDYSARFSQDVNQAYAIDTSDSDQYIILDSALTSAGGSLTKQGAGTLVLTGTNSYTGNTSIISGTLVVSGLLADSSNVSVATDATYQVDETDTIGSIAGNGTINLNQRSLTAGGSNSTTTFSGVMLGEGSFIKAGTGTLTLSGNNNYNLGTTLAGGTLSLDSNEALGTEGTLRFSGGSLQFTANNTTDYSARFSQDVNQAYAIDTNGQNITLANVLTSAGGSLTKQGAGTLTLTGTNSYTGNTSIDSGTLLVSGLLADSSNVSVATGATYELGATDTIGSIAGNGTINIYSYNLTAGGADASTTFGGVLAGTGSFTKAGTGTLTLSGNNTYTGGTTLAGGTLSLGANEALGTEGTLSFSGGSLQFTANNTTDYSARFSQDVNQAYAIDTNGQNISLGTVLTSDGGSLTKQGTGTLTLTGNNTYTGSTTIDAGALQIGNGSDSASISNSSIGYLGIDSGSNGTASVSTGGTWTTTGDLFVGYAGNGNLTVSGGTVSNVNGVIGAMAGDVENNIAGSNGSVTISGGNWTNSGSLTVGSGGTGSLIVSGGNVSNVNGAIGYESSATISGGNWTNSGNLYIAANANSTLTITGGLVTVAGTLTKMPAGKINLNAGGTLSIGAGGTTGELNTNGNFTYDGTLIFNRTAGYTYSGNLGGSGALIKQESNALILTGTNTYNGTTTISAGTLQIGNSALTGSISSSSNIINNAILDFKSSNNQTYGGQISGSGALDKRQGGTLILSGNNTYTGDTTIYAGTLQIGNGGTSGSLVSNVSGGPLVFNRSDSSTYGGGFSGSTLTKLGAGTLTLTGNNTYTGSTTISAGTLQIGDGGTTGAISNSSGITNNANLAFNRSDATSYSRVISGSGNLTQLGSGTLSLTGTNTYTGSTTISAGTLQIGAGGTSGAISNSSNITNNAALVFNRSDDTTYAGSISGTGAVTKSGAGTLTLASTNTHTGGTQLDGGALEALHANALGNGALTLSSGTLAVGNTANPNLSLSGMTDLVWSSSNAAISLAHGGNITISGNFSNGGNTGNRTFDFGIGQSLQLGNNTLVSFGATNFSASNFAAAISGSNLLSGTFQILGNSLVYNLQGGKTSGNVIDNSGPYDTPTWVDFTVNGNTGNGTVITAGGNNTIRDLAFTNNGNLAIQAGYSLTLSQGQVAVENGSSVVSGGALATPGNFNKTGAGELDVQSTLSVNGTASIDAGLLSVNGNLTANSVAVNSGAILGGSGAIFAPVTVSGTLAPGNSPGTLSMASLALTPSAVTDIEIESLTNFDRLVVGGAATVDGTLNVIPYNGKPLAYGQQYSFLTAGGGISGEFDTITAPVTFRGRFLNLGTTGILLIAPDSYTRVAVTPNQREVAKALDSFIPATSGDQQTVSIALDLQTAEQYPTAFEQIMPGFYESLANIAIEQAFAQTQMLNQRISSVRLGAAGFQAIGGISQPLLHDKNGKSAAKAKDASPIVERATATNWNAWALGTGMFSRSTNLGSLQNYNNDAGGFLVGSDYRWSENFVTGLYAGYDYSYAEYNGGGSTKGNSFSFGTYASYEKDGYYADAVIGGGYTGFQTKRSIEFRTIDRTASADPNSGQFTAGLNLGKDFEVGKFTLGPIVGAQYTYAGIGSFTESGAESLDLSLGQQNANSLRSTLGGRIAYTWNLNQKIALIPEVRMFWQHEFLNNPRTINASLDGGSGPSFGYETTDPYRNSVFAGAGVTAQFGKNLSGSVFYNINFGSQTYQSNMVSAGLNFSF